MKSRFCAAVTVAATGATLATACMTFAGSTAQASTPRPASHVAKGVAPQSHPRPARIVRQNRLARAVHVTTTGSDAGDGTAAHPFRTIQSAVDHAPVNATIYVAAGSYAPFVAGRAGQTILGAGATQTTIVGTMTARDGIAVQAANVTIAKLGVVDCVAKNIPGDGFENQGAAAISINSAGSGAQISAVTLTGKTTLNSYGMNFGCYGVAVRDADHVTITKSDISGLGYGVFLRHGGTGTVVSDNRIHDNNAMIRNTPMPDDDFGASGVGFNMMAPAAPGTTVSGNTIFNNVAPSHDYVTDGGGFDLFGSSNVSMIDNTLANNEDVLESGAPANVLCPGVVFSGNVSSGRTPGSTLKHAAGMYLRCGAGMQITGNTFTNLDWWTFVVAPQSRNIATLRGTTISGNTVTQGYDTIWGINQSPAGCNYNFGQNNYAYRGSFGVDWTGRRMSNQTDFMTALAAAA